MFLNFTKVQIKLTSTRAVCILAFLDMYKKKLQRWWKIRLEILYLGQRLVAYLPSNSEGRVMQIGGHNKIFSDIFTQLFNDFLKIFLP